MPTAKRTAQTVFNQRADDCAALLDHLGEMIAKTREQFKTDSTNWGYAGSMGEVRSNLIQTMAFIGGLEEEDIEATLADLRE